MSLIDQIKQSILQAIPGAEVEVSGASGHFEIYVCSSEFEGQRILQKQRRVYSAIKHLMAGDNAPLHAVDRMVCEVPE